MNGTVPASQQTGTKLIDDFLRRELRVGDPKSAAEVATALRTRYATEAARIDDEGRGLAVQYGSEVLLPTLAPSGGDTPGSREERRVRANLESDLDVLINSPNNREWKPELVGWRNALSREFTDGPAAARSAQDPAMRHRGFYSVRRLAEFARLARLVGVVNAPLNCDYRRLAGTLDEAANVLRIVMGEALYDAGLAEGGFVLQVPLTDLRLRRDTLVLAVRRLSGGSEESDDGGDWGNALAAYQALLSEIEAQAASELAVYLREELLAPILDSLVTSVARQDPESLRQVAATAPVEVARLDQLLGIAAEVARRVEPEAAAASNTGDPPASAALSYFVWALRLFVDAFAASRSGARLVDLAVPLPLAAQQGGNADGGTRATLRSVVSNRGVLAREAECHVALCGYDLPSLKRQVQLDKVLYDVDCAIDLYAQGVEKAGDEEKRAAVYSLILRALIARLPAIPAAPATDPYADLRRTLDALAGSLEAPGVPQLADPLTKKVAQDQRAAEEAWQKFVKVMAPGCAARLELVKAGQELLEGIPTVAVSKRAYPSPVAVRILMRKSVAVSERIAKEARVAAKATEASANVQFANTIVGLQASLTQAVGKKTREDLRSDPQLVGYARWLVSSARPLAGVTIPGDLESSLDDFFFKPKPSPGVIDKGEVDKFTKAALRALAHKGR
jgi:hypothetical protein